MTRRWTRARLMLAILASAGYADATGSPPDALALFEQGNRLYQAEDYAGAAQAYEAILDLGAVAPEVYFNLGNAALRRDDVGRAVWAYAKAEQLDPWDADIRANLEFARGLTADAAPEREGSRMLGAVVSAVSILPEPAVWTLALGAYWALGIAAVVALLLPGWRRGRGALFWTLGVACVVLVGSLGLRRAIDAGGGPSAVVLVPELDVTNEPGDDSRTVFTLHAGTEVRVARELGRWREIALGSDLKGWVPADAVAEL